MFKFLPATFAIDASHQASTEVIPKTPMKQKINPLHQSSTLLIATLTGVLFLTGCQQQSETPPVTKDTQPTEKTSAEDSQPMQQSDSAAARIEQFQPIYLAQVQGLQRRLQAEYESLQAADASDSENSLLSNDTVDETNDASGINASNINENNKNNSNGEMAGSDGESTTASNNINANQAADVTATEGETDPAIEGDINTSTEVGERDLTVLKRISLEPRKPTMLTDDQIIDRYQQAMDALYQPVTTPLGTEDVETLIDVATLVPQLFEHAEIAGRVSAKSPALARLIIQHQVWEQIQAQQIIDMQQMKVNQHEEFETLMGKFNDTIKGYDEQIAKYEQTLRTFQ